MAVGPDRHRAFRRAAIAGSLAVLLAAPLWARGEPTRWRLLAYDDDASYYLHADSVQRDGDTVVFWLKKKPKVGGYVSKKIHLFCADFTFRWEASMDSSDGRAVDRTWGASQIRPLDEEPLLLKCFDLFCGDKTEVYGPEGNLEKRGWTYRPPGGGEQAVGPWTYWYSDGGRRESLRFRRGEKDGPWIAWDRNGHKRKEQHFREGRPDGQWLNWYPNGRKSAETNYRDGRLHGRSARWDERGRLIEETWYDDGRVVDKPPGDRAVP